MTIFGTPVVPEVSSTHSVRRRAGEAVFAGTIEGRAGNTHGKLERRARLRIALDHHGIDLGRFDQSAEMTGFGIGRQNGDATRAAIELDQRQRGGELARGGEKHRAAGQILEPAAEAGAVNEVGEADGSVVLPEKSRRCARHVVPQRRRLSARHFRRLSRSRRASPERRRPRRR